jgi:ankyrin repeat protein
MEAARSGGIEVVDLLLSHGASVDLKDRQRRTALMWAATKGDWPKVVSRLLKAGADLGLVDRTGNTAGSRAKHMQARNTVKILTKYRPDGRSLQR